MVKITYISKAHSFVTLLSLANTINLISCFNTIYMSISFIGSSSILTFITSPLLFVFVRVFYLLPYLVIPHLELLILYAIKVNIYNYIYLIKAHMFYCLWLITWTIFFISPFNSTTTIYSQEPFLGHNKKYFLFHLVDNAHK